MGSYMWTSVLADQAILTFIRSVETLGAVERTTKTDSQWGRGVRESQRNPYSRDAFRDWLMFLIHLNTKLFSRILYIELFH